MRTATGLTPKLQLPGWDCIKPGRTIREPNDPIKTPGLQEIIAKWSQEKPRKSTFKLKDPLSNPNQTLITANKFTNRAMELCKSMSAKPSVGKWVPNAHWFQFNISRACWAEITNNPQKYWIRFVERWLPKAKAQPLSGENVRNQLCQSCQPIPGSWFKLLVERLVKGNEH